MKVAMIVMKMVKLVTNFEESATDIQTISKR